MSDSNLIIAIVAETNRDLSSLGLKAIIQDQQNLNCIGIFENLASLSSIANQTEPDIIVFMGVFPDREINRLHVIFRDATFCFSEDLRSRTNINSENWFNPNNSDSFLQLTERISTQKKKYSDVNVQIKGIGHYLRSVDQAKSSFTQAQLELLRYYSQGYSLDSIANLLDLSDKKAVRTRLYTIRDALGCRDLTEVMVAIFRGGLVLDQS